MNAQCMDLVLFVQHLEQLLHGVNILLSESELQNVEHPVARFLRIAPHQKEKVDIVSKDG
jgi:hypothetical protein